VENSAIYCPTGYIMSAVHQ